MSAAAILIDGAAQTQIDVRDRALAYGDGLFETIRFQHGVAPLWTRHMQRLQIGCDRLRLAAPAPALWLAECRQALAALAADEAVVRLSLSRGVGARGYAPTPGPARRIVQALSAPSWGEADYRDGVRVRRCRMRLAWQPRLAGIKHLNRLEQVLARAEWQDPAIAEGLLLDRRGRVISATAANLFVVLDGRLLTPSVRRCGIAGVGRAEVLQARPTAAVVDLHWEQLLRAEEWFLVSSVRGILPVRELAGQWRAPGPLARGLQQHWRDLGFSLPAAEEQRE